MRRIDLLSAAALLLLTSCAAEESTVQQQPVYTETSFDEPEQTAESSDSESAAETSESPAETQPPESEFAFGTVAEKAELLQYDEFTQERLMFSAFDADYAEGNVLRQGFVLGAAEQLERCKAVFTDTAARIGSEAAEEEAQAAAGLLDAFAVFAAIYSSEEYMFLVFCGENAFDRSEYRSYLGTDIAFDGEHIELIPRYEITDEEAALDEKLPAVSPPQYLWVAAVPRTFLTA